MRGVSRPQRAAKPTPFRLFGGMIFPTKGSALINGVEAHRNKRRALDCAGFLVEPPEIYPAMTPREALSPTARIRGISSGERSPRTAAVLAEVARSEWIDKRIGGFSKGMTQRSNIAAVLLPEPEIVILDELTTGSDPRGVAGVRDVVHLLKRR